MTVTEALGAVLAFDPDGDGLAQKSKELVVGLLNFTDAPFSRTQFKPGHITCTAMVRHPRKPLVLFIHHHRLQRWLLPGGHVEEEDADLASTAAREATEETLVQISPAGVPRLIGIDVHGIPGKRKRNEPYHLHHDLIWCFRASREDIAPTEEAHSVVWGGESDWDRLAVDHSIRRSILRASL